MADESTYFLFERSSGGMRIRLCATDKDKSETEFRYSVQHLYTLCHFVENLEKMVLLDSSPLLKISNTETLSQFIHDCVNDLISGKYRKFDNYNSDIEWTEKDFERARSWVQNYYRECALNQDTNSKNISDLPKDVQNVIKDCYKVRQQEILQTLARKNLLHSGVKNLVDNIDWKLKWVMGSSKLSSHKEVLLQMDLSCAEENDVNCVINKNISFEMNLEQIDKLLNVLEKAKNDLSRTPITD